MAAREDGGHPFNWFIIGFVVGVAATLGALLWLNASHDRRPDRDEPEAAATEAEPARAIPAPHAAAAIPALPAPPKKVVAPTETHARPTARESDEQMAEDAAAAGMTSRTNPGQAQPQDPQ